MLDLLFGPSGAMRKRAADVWTSLGAMPRVGRMGTLAGPIVDEDLALTLSAVWSCTRLICETIAALPLQVYERDGNDRKLATDLPIYDVLHARPNERMAEMPFREGRTAHQVNWGNGFAEIERNYNDEIVNLWPIHPTRVYNAPREDARRGYPYKVRNPDGSSESFRADELAHIPGTLSEDGIWGKGVIQYARESVGFGMATERHGAAYFGSGAQPKGVLSMPGLRDKEKRREYRAEWKEVHASPDSAEIAILPVDAKFVPISISNEDSQFLETRKFNGVIVCQWYRVAPHLIGLLDAANKQNIEQQGIEFVIYTLYPWVRRQEGQYNLKLLTADQRRNFFIEHNFAGLLRGDLKTRMDSYVHAIQNGIMTINEVRRLENLNAIGPAGDVNYIQLNMTTAQRMLEEPNPTRATASQAAVGADLLRLITAAAPSVPKPPATSLQPVLADALERMFRKEANAVRRAIKGNARDFAHWLGAFGRKHQRTIENAVAPVCRATPGLAPAAIAARAIETSAAQLLEAYDQDTPAEFAARLDAWGPTRAKALAAELLTTDHEAPGTEPC